MRLNHTTPKGFCGLNGKCIECVENNKINGFPNLSILLGDHSVLDPPDSIPNSAVKRNSVDGSVGSPHVRVEHRQAFNCLSWLLLVSFDTCDAHVLMHTALLSSKSTAHNPRYAK